MSGIDDLHEKSTGVIHQYAEDWPRISVFYQVSRLFPVRTSLKITTRKKKNKIKITIREYPIPRRVSRQLQPTLSLKSPIIWPGLPHICLHKCLTLKAPLPSIPPTQSYSPHLSPENPQALTTHHPPATHLCLSSHSGCPHLGEYLSHPNWEPGPRLPFLPFSWSFPNSTIHHGTYQAVS